MRNSVVYLVYFKKKRFVRKDRLFCFKLFFIYFFNNKLVLFFLFLIFLFFSFFLKKSFFRKNKLKSFESGFRTIDLINFRFSIHFYLILLVFVLFDMEVILILVFFWAGNLIFFLFFLVLILMFFGFLLEWKKKKLIWIF